MQNKFSIRKKNEHGSHEEREELKWTHSLSARLDERGRRRRRETTKRQAEGRNVGRRRRMGALVEMKVTEDKQWRAMEAAPTGQRPS